MRQFTDKHGRRWDAAVESGSYGINMIVFVPEGGGDVRTSMLASEVRLEAARELDGLSDDELRGRLEDSRALGEDPFGWG